MISYDWTRQRTLAPRIQGTTVNYPIMIDISNRALGSLQNSGNQLFTPRQHIPLYNATDGSIFSRHNVRRQNFPYDTAPDNSNVNNRIQYSGNYFNTDPRLDNLRNHDPAFPGQQL